VCQMCAEDHSQETNRGKHPVFIQSSTKSAGGSNPAVGCFEYTHGGENPTPGAFSYTKLDTVFSADKLE
jgi:hypothetical protein